MRNSIITSAAAGALAFWSSTAFAVQTTDVRIETGAQLASACNTYLAEGAQETENVVRPIDPCRAFLTGFASAYGIGQSKTLESRVTNAAPSPPPPAQYKMGQWTKPEPPPPGPTVGPSAPKEEKMACFALPPYLSYRDFAKLVVDFVSAHADYGTTPAYITAAAALAGKYPCK
jgi:hypothetical protein